MEKPEDHGGGRPSNKYCKYCTDENGMLKSREEVREGWVQFAINAEALSREEAEKKVDEEMAQMPAWKE